MIRPAQYTADRCRTRIVARGLVLACLAATLAGCQHNPFADWRGHESLGSTPPPADYRDRHPIAIREGERTLEILIGTSRGGLTTAQRTDVLAFARVWRREATGGIIIDVPTGTSNAAAANDAVREVRALLAGAAVPTQAVSVRSYTVTSPKALATIKLNYPKMLAEAGPCGQWPEDLGPTWGRTYLENRQFYNFGCSSQRNLAAMVQNPADLVQPRDDTEVYAPRRQTVVEKYRKGESPATVYPDRQQGRVSNVGQ